MHRSSLHRSPRLARTLRGCVLLAASAACTRAGTPARAPSGAASAPTAAAVPSGPRPTVAVLNVAFYGKRANSIEPGDSAIADVATGRIWSTLREANAFDLVDSARVAAAARAGEAPGVACNTNVACARGVGQRLGARWVLMAKASKTSNLIWYFSGQLVDVATGRFLMDDEFELKGVRDDMIPRGAVSLARRAVRVAERETAATAAH